VLNAEHEELEETSEALHWPDLLNSSRSMTTQPFISTMTQLLCNLLAHRVDWVIEDLCVI
jgi:hypothetical protein